MPRAARLPSRCRKWRRRYREDALTAARGVIVARGEQGVRDTPRRERALGHANVHVRVRAEC